MMSNTPRYIRQYVEVNVNFDRSGKMMPRALVWEDGHRYEIDKVRDIQPAPALKAGGQGDRYKIEIGGKERFLFFEHSADPCDAMIGKWFVERKVGP
jgi:hypothetical protein